MMSAEGSYVVWEEAQRLAQGFTGLIQSHIPPSSFQWPTPLFKEFPTQNFIKNDFGFPVDNSAINNVAAIFDITNRIGQAGADFVSGLNGAAQQLLRWFPVPVPFLNDMNAGASMSTSSTRRNMGVTLQEDLGTPPERFKDYGFSENGPALEEGSTEDVMLDDIADALKRLGRSQGISVTSTYSSRTRNIESSLVAEGDLWRVEASQGSSTSGNGNLSLSLVYLGPVIFLRDSTLLLPVNLSEQHVLWYGYNRKNGTHSLYPDVWSEHRRWRLMSMICLNPLACSFVDLQFPNGQVTYVSGEGLSTSAFMPLCGGLVQAQGQYPGEMKFSFSCKNKWGTRITPTVQWPDKSFALGLEQELAWKKSGLRVRPMVQFSLCPTFGGSCPGLRMELSHAVKKDLNLMCGCALVRHPSAYASVSVGRSKSNGNVGKTGVVVKVETPLGNIGRPSFSVQLNSGIDF